MQKRRSGPVTSQKIRGEIHDEIRVKVDTNNFFALQKLMEVCNEMEGGYHDSIPELREVKIKQSPGGKGCVVKGLR